MHREAVTQQTKKEGHSGASVISGLFPGVQVERDWWGALQQVCSCRSRLAHKTQADNDRATWRDTLREIQPKQFLLVSRQVLLDSREEPETRFRFTQLGEDVLASLWVSELLMPFYTTADLLQDIHHIYVDWASTAKEQHQTLQLTLRPSPFLHQQVQHGRYVHLSAWNSVFAEQNGKKKIMFCCIFEKERFRFGLDLTIKLTSVS